MYKLFQRDTNNWMGVEVVATGDLLEQTLANDVFEVALVQKLQVPQPQPLEN